MTFAERLTAAARPRDLATNPFVLDVRAGRASRESIRNFAIHVVGAAESFIGSLYAILAACDDRSVRQSLLGNVLEEEGATHFSPSEGLVIDPVRHHPTIGYKFVRATGATEADVAAAGVQPPRWFRRALAEGNWVGAYSYIAVGVEANAPATYSMLLEPLAAHYGFDEDALHFFVEHTVADVRHGDAGLEMLKSVARTDQMRSQALEGARRGGTAWWQLLTRHAAAPSSAQHAEHQVSASV